jgi:hypothetical protein
MTPRRALVMRTFAQAYIADLPPDERIAFLRAEMLSIDELVFWRELSEAAAAIRAHADQASSEFLAFKYQLGVSP